MTVSGKARVAGVMGWPVSHSSSPAMHNFWLAELGIDGAYVPLPVERFDFARVVDGLRRTGFAGVNVTMPHKDSAFAISHTHDVAAVAARAVNLLVFEGSRIHGRNTDADGLRGALADVLGTALNGRIAVLLGAGGAARAAILALSALGAAEIRVLNRNGTRASSIAADMGRHVKSRLVAGSLADWATAAGDAALLVNATSAGMKGQPALDLPLDPLPKEATVCDVVTSPLETGLLKAARARGHVCIDGLGMLMHQAVPSFAAFYGVTPKVTPQLRAHLENMLTS